MFKPAARCLWEPVLSWESARTLEEARRAKAARHTDIGCGEVEQRSRITLHAYLREWIERYQGTGRRGYREETREEDRRLLHRYTLRYFPERLKLTELTPSMVAQLQARGWPDGGPVEAGANTRSARSPRAGHERAAAQVQRWLGHHSPAFTLSTYVHRLDGDPGEPLAPHDVAPALERAPDSLVA